MKTVNSLKAKGKMSLPIFSLILMSFQPRFDFMLLGNKNFALPQMLQKLWLLKQLN